MKQFVIYTRVSTKSQGDSGLGLEAQERDINLYLDNYAEEPHEVIGRFCDVESGTRADRPQMQEALELVKLLKTWARLVYLPSCKAPPTTSINLIVNVPLTPMLLTSQLSWRPLISGSILAPFNLVEPLTYLKPAGKLSKIVMSVSATGKVFFTVMT